MEIETKDTYFGLFGDKNLGLGRMISWSKSTYRKMNPDNIVIFNANIFTEEDGKIWFGDLDVTLDADTLKSLSKQMGKKLYILSEHMGRWSNSDVDLGKSYFIVDGDELIKNY